MPIRFLLTTALFFCLTFVKLNAQSGNLVVFSPVGSHFWLSLDGKLQNAKPEKNVKITGMPEGDCFINLEFWSKDLPPMKQAIKVIAGKETSFIVKKEADRLVLEEYSSVPLAQVGSNPTQSKQFQSAYNRNGVTKENVDKVEEEPNIFVSRSVPNPNENNNSGQVYIGGEHAAKREGQFKITEKTPENNTVNPEPATKPAINPADYPQTTEVVTYKLEIKGSDTTIVEQKQITTKELVEMNGQKFIKSKNETREKVTSYICVPMSKEDFQAGLVNMQIAAASPLHNAVQQFGGKCLTGAQLNELKTKVPDWNALVEAGNFRCADPNDCPIISKAEPIVAKVEEPVKVVDEPKKEEPKVIETPKEEPKPKTAAELKAELKAAKKREKEAKKAAKKK